MEKITIKVKGMKCPSCEMLVQDILEEQEGVVEVKVSYADKRAEVSFDGDKITGEQIKNMIAKEGYTVG